MQQVCVRAVSSSRWILSYQLPAVLLQSLNILNTLLYWLLSLANTVLATLRASSGAVYCNRPCLRVCGFVCLSVCYHDNSKLRISIFTKLGLKVKVAIISSWLNFGHPAPPGRGSAAGRNFWLRLTTASAQCLRLSERFFHWYFVFGIVPSPSCWQLLSFYRIVLHILYDIARCLTDTIK